MPLTPITGFKKTVACITLVCFAFTNTVWGMPEGGITFTPRRETPSFLQIEIPSDLASIEEIYEAPRLRSVRSPERFESKDEAPAKIDPKLILHIQNIHGNYESQTQIKKILEYLHQKYGFKLIFAEGAQDKLDPDLLRFFPDKERNEKLANAMTQEGKLTGIEYFLMNGPPEVEAIGIEQAELYRQNYEAFKKVYGSKDEIDRFLSHYESKLETLSSRLFPADTRRLLSEWKKFEAGRREFLPYVKQIVEEAKSLLDLDLESLFAQVEWPQITRLLALQSMEKDLNREKAEQEKDRLIEFLKAKRAAREIISAIEKLNEKQITVSRMDVSDRKLENLPRYLLERLVEDMGPKGFRFHDYPAFSLWAGSLILQKELDTRLLFEEIESVFTKLLDQVSRTEQEKNLLELYRDSELLRKLLHLELTRKEWDRVSYRKDWLTLPALAGRLKKLAEKVNFGLDWEADPWLRNPEENTKEVLSIKNLQETSYTFYDFARRRESAFFETIKSQMELRRTEKAIIVTGGFHTDGLMDLFRENEINCGVLMPRLSETLDNSGYIANMLGKNATLFDFATIEAISSMLSREVQELMGMNTVQAVLTPLSFFVRHRFKSVEELAQILGKNNKTQFPKSGYKLILSPNRESVAFWIRRDLREAFKAYGFQFTNKGQLKSKRGHLLLMDVAEDRGEFVLRPARESSKEHKARLPARQARSMEKIISPMRHAPSSMPQSKRVRRAEVREDLSSAHRGIVGGEKSEVRAESRGASVIKKYLLKFKWGIGISTAFLIAVVAINISHRFSQDVVLDRDLVGVDSVSFIEKRLEQAEKFPDEYARHTTLGKGALAIAMLAESGSDQITPNTISALERMLHAEKDIVGRSGLSYAALGLAKMGMRGDKLAIETLEKVPQDLPGHRYALSALETVRYHNQIGEKSRRVEVPPITNIIFIDDVTESQRISASQLVRFGKENNIDVVETNAYDFRFVDYLQKNRSIDSHIVLFGGKFGACIAAQVSGMFQKIFKGPNASITYITLPLPAIYMSHNPSLDSTKYMLPDVLANNSTNEELYYQPVTWGDYDIWKIPLDSTMNVAIAKNGIILREINLSGKRKIIVNVLTNQKAIEELILKERKSPDRSKARRDPLESDKQHGGASRVSKEEKIIINEVSLFGELDNPNIQRQLQDHRTQSKWDPSSGSPFSGNFQNQPRQSYIQDNTRDKGNQKEISGSQESTQNKSPQYHSRGIVSQLLKSLKLIVREIFHIRNIVVSKSKESVSLLFQLVNNIFIKYKGKEHGAGNMEKQRGIKDFSGRRRVERIEKTVNGAVADDTTKLFVPSRKPLTTLPVVSPKVSLVGSGADEQRKSNDFLDLGAGQAAENGDESFWNAVSFHNKTNDSREVFLAQANNRRHNSKQQSRGGGRAESRTLYPKGLLTTGIWHMTRNDYEYIRNYGLQPRKIRNRKEKIDPNYFPDKVSLSLSLDNKFFSSSLNHYGALETANGIIFKSINFIIGPEYVANHPEKFKLVGRHLLRESYRGGMQILGLDKNELSADENAFWDEIHIDQLPTEAILGIIAPPGFAEILLHWDAEFGSDPLPLYLLKEKAGKIPQSLELWSRSEARDETKKFANEAKGEEEERIKDESGDDSYSNRLGIWPQQLSSTQLLRVLSGFQPFTFLLLTEASPTLFQTTVGWSLLKLFVQQEDNQKRIPRQALKQLAASRHPLKTLQEILFDELLVAQMKNMTLHAKAFGNSAVKLDHRGLIITTRAEARKSFLNPKDFIWNRVEHWEEILEYGAFAFDMQKTLAARKKEATDRMIELLIWLMEEGHRVLIDTGNAEEEVLRQVIYKLQRVLTSRGKRHLLQRLIIYANSSTTRIFFDEKGDIQHDFKYQRKYKISRRIEQAIYQALKELGNEHQFFVKPEDQKAIKEIKNFYESEKKKFPEGTVFQVPWMEQRQYEPSITTPAESKGELTLPLFERRGLVDGRPTAIALREIPPFLRSTITRRLKALLKKKLGTKIAREIRLRPGGDTSIDIVLNADKATALEYEIKTKKLSRQRIYGHGDELRREPLGNDASLLRLMIQMASFDPAPPEGLSRAQKSRTAYFGGEEVGAENYLMQLREALNQYRAMRYLRQFLGLKQGERFDKKRLQALKNSFEELTPEGKQRFTHKLLEILYGAHPERFSVHESNPETKKASELFAVNGIPTLDLHLVLAENSGDPSLTMESHQVSLGGTGALAMRVMKPFSGHRAKFLGIADPEARQIIRMLLQQESIGTSEYLDGEHSRVNLYISGPDAEYDFRPPVPRMSEKEARDLIDHVDRFILNASSKNSLVILGGQIFPNVSPRYYTELIQVFKQKGYRVLYDFKPYVTSNEVTAILKAGPSILKPNLQEFAQMFGQDAQDLRGKYEEIAGKAAEKIDKHPIDVILISMDREGAIAVYREKGNRIKAIHVPAIPVKETSAFGPGDSLIGGFLSQYLKGEGIAESLIQGVAAGTAAVQLPATKVGNKKTIEKIARKMKAQKGGEEEIFSRRSEARLDPSLNSIYLIPEFGLTDQEREELANLEPGRTLTLFGGKEKQLQRAELRSEEDPRSWTYDPAFHEEISRMTGIKIRKLTARHPPYTSDQILNGKIKFGISEKDASYSSDKSQSLTNFPGSNKELSKRAKPRPKDSFYSSSFLGGKIAAANAKIKSSANAVEQATTRLYLMNNPPARQAGTRSFQVSNKVLAITSRRLSVKNGFITAGIVSLVSNLGNIYLTNINKIKDYRAEMRSNGGVVLSPHFDNGSALIQQAVDQFFKKLSIFDRESIVTSMTSILYLGISIAFFYFEVNFISRVIFILGNLTLIPALIMALVKGKRKYKTALPMIEQIRDYGHLFNRILHYPRLENEHFFVSRDQKLSEVTVLGVQLMRKGDDLMFLIRPFLQWEIFEAYLQERLRFLNRYYAEVIFDMSQIKQLLNKGLVQEVSGLIDHETINREIGYIHSVEDRLRKALESEGAARAEMRGKKEDGVLSVFAVSVGIAAAFVTKAVEQGGSSLGIRLLQGLIGSLADIVLGTISNYLGQGVYRMGRNWWRALKFALIVQFSFWTWFAAKPFIRLQLDDYGPVMMVAVDTLMSVVMIGSLAPSIWKAEGYSLEQIRKKMRENYWSIFGFSSVVWGGINLLIYRIPADWAFVIPVISSVTAFIVNRVISASLYRDEIPEIERLKRERIWGYAGLSTPVISLAIVSGILAKSPVLGMMGGFAAGAALIYPFARNYRKQSLRELETFLKSIDSSTRRSEVRLTVGEDLINAKISSYRQQLQQAFEREKYFTEKYPSWDRIHDLFLYTVLTGIAGYHYWSVHGILGAAFWFGAFLLGFFTVSGIINRYNPFFDLKYQLKMPNFGWDRELNDPPVWVSALDYKLNFLEIQAKENKWVRHEKVVNLILSAQEEFLLGAATSKNPKSRKAENWLAWAYGELLEKIYRDDEILYFAGKEDLIEKKRILSQYSVRLYEIQPDENPPASLTEVLRFIAIVRGAIPGLSPQSEEQTREIFQKQQINVNSSVPPYRSEVRLKEENRSKRELRLISEIENKIHETRDKGRWLYGGAVLEDIEEGKIDARWVFFDMDLVYDIDDQIAAQAERFYQIRDSQKLTAEELLEIKQRVHTLGYDYASQTLQAMIDLYDLMGGDTFDYDEASKQILQEIALGDELEDLEERLKVLSGAIQDIDKLILDIINDTLLIYLRRAHQDELPEARGLALALAYRRFYRHKSQNGNGESEKALAQWKRQILGSPDFYSLETLLTKDLNHFETDNFEIDDSEKDDSNTSKDSLVVGDLRPTEMKQVILHTAVNGEIKDWKIFSNWVNRRVDPKKTSSKDQVEGIQIVRVILENDSREDDDVERRPAGNFFDVDLRSILLKNRNGERSEQNVEFSPKLGEVLKRFFRKSLFGPDAVEVKPPFDLRILETRVHTREGVGYRHILEVRKWPEKKPQRSEARTSLSVGSKVVERVMAMRPRMMPAPVIVSCAAGGILEEPTYTDIELLIRGLESRSASSEAIHGLVNATWLKPSNVAASVLVVINESPTEEQLSELLSYAAAEMKPNPETRLGLMWVDSKAKYRQELPQKVSEILTKLQKQLGEGQLQMKISHPKDLNSHLMQMRHFLKVKNASQGNFAELYISAEGLDEFIEAYRNPLLPKEMVLGYAGELSPRVLGGIHVAIRTAQGMRAELRKQFKDLFTMRGFINPSALDNVMSNLMQTLDQVVALMRSA